ncbi:shikimate dehydrogenase [Rickettsiales bacterium]|nr:shikimate dehydrogenase [Rickettsiales bacterium]
MKKILVIGNPIKHSKSPDIHNTWLKERNIKVYYDKLKVNKKELKNLVNRVRSETLIGINVTVPYKKDIITYLDLLDNNSINSGAVNTIYKKKSNIIGTNTDGDGFLNSVKKDARFLINKNSNIFIIGAGGAARGIIFSLINKNVNKIYITNRTLLKKKELINNIKLKINFKNLVEQDWKEKVIPGDVDLVVNTSSFGMKKNEKLDFDFSKCKENLLAYDIIYSPIETYFLKIAKSKGFKTQNGMGMLIRQAALSFYKWFGKKITEKEIIKMIKSFEDKI